MNAHERIIDANVNRLREGLRVLEDLGRFKLEDPKLALRIKQMRHCLKEIEKNPRYLNRDSSNDVGASLDPDSEFSRTGWMDLIKSNAKRSQEAARVLEELFKFTHAETSRLFKQIRFELYEIEKELILRLGSQKILPQPLLYFIVTVELCKSREILTMIEGALRGGVGALQIRSKTLADRDLIEIGTKVTKLCAKSHALFIINDRVDVALALDADGIHLGQEDFPIALARQLVGPDKWIGFSCHNTSQLNSFDRRQVDYVGMGPIFETTTKENPDPVVGTKCLENSIDFPLIAIGGITLTNVDQVVSAGCNRVAVGSGLIEAPDIEFETRKFLEILQGVRP